MLGKRSWAVRRKTSISNMNSAFSTGSTSRQPQSKERWPSRSTPPATPPTSVLRQVIGFNPTPRNESEKAATGPLSLFPADGKEARGKSPRSPISPRSALQSLLAASRQGEEGKESKSSSLSSTLKQNTATEKAGEVGSIQDRNERGPVFAQSIVQKAFISSTLKQSPPHAKGTGCALDLKQSPWMNISVQSSRYGHEGVVTARVQEDFDSQPMELNSQETERQRTNSRHFLFVATSPIIDSSMSTPTVDFLDHCYLCKRRLGQGLDIFMYRGDKAFCSVECRYQQIVIDEGKEKHSPSLLRSGSAAPARHARHRRSILATGTAAVG